MRYNGLDTSKSSNTVKVLENVGVGTELAKRTYIDGATLTKDCSCGEEMSYDLGEEYLSYPTVGEYQSICIYCEDCGNEHEGALKVRIVLNLEIDDYSGGG